MNIAQSLRAMVKIDVLFTKNCTDEQKFACNNRKSYPAVYKYCAHPSTNAHPPLITRLIVTEDLTDVVSVQNYDARITDGGQTVRKA